MNEKYVYCHQCGQYSKYETNPNGYIICGKCGNLYHLDLVHEVNNKKVEELIK